MKVRLSLALIVCLVGVGLIPGPAAGDRPEREEFSPVGDQFLCCETLLTVTDGTIVAREHVHELKSGLEEVGFFRHKLNFIGPGGLLGTLGIREQRKRNGDVVFRDKGTCQFVEDDEE